AGYPYPRPQARPVQRPLSIQRPSLSIQRPHIPLTLAATLAVAAAVVVLLGVWFAGRDTLPPTPTLAQGGVLPVTPALLATRTPAPSATLPGSVTPTPVSDLGILATNVLPPPTPTPTNTAQRPPASWVPPTITMQPTPAARFGDLIGYGYDLVTTAPVGELAAGSRVRISHAYYTRTGWIYGIVSYPNEVSAEAAEHQLRYDRLITPTAAFNRALREGTWVQTRTLVGDIPAGTPVRIGSALYNGSHWEYEVFTAGELHATAYEWELSQIVSTTSPPVTPTMTFSGLIGGPFRFYLRADAGLITQQDIVRLVEARYDAEAGGWIYTVVTQDGRSAEVPLYLLVYPPPTATPTVTPTVTPTATPTPTPLPSATPLPPTATP
ncbi:MAG: hypothetical protein JXN59_16925, partial [Anaerolineae bacterium]|nr:hypothetical protein [Anaerolineae bacterium]